MQNFHRFVFPPDIDFDNALDVLASYGFSLYEMNYEAEDLYIRIYKKEFNIVNVVTDESVDISYITLSNLHKYAKQMINEMGVIDNKEALSYALEMGDFKASYYVTMSSNKGFNNDTYNFIKDRLNQSDSKVRHHAIVSIVYLVGIDWKDKIKRLLQEALSNEKVEENKIAAEEVLKAMDKNSWNEK